MTSRCDECRPDEIVRLVRSRDLAALDRITRCYGDHLLAVGRRVCGDDDRARDAVQDALLSAGRHLDRYRGEGPVEGWLTRMVANACLTRRRGRKDQPAWNSPFDERERPTDAERPDEAAARAELAGALRSALLELSPVDRAILLLTQVDGVPATEVARRLEVSSDTVRARLSRARRRLRARLHTVRGDWS